MFTGIIETLGEVTALEQELSNLHISVRSYNTHELKIDQSVAHNGVCLTVVLIEGEVYAVEQKLRNLYMSVRSNISHELKIYQSVWHIGVCLTVVRIEGDVYTVTAIAETLSKSNLSDLKVGDPVNLERCMQLGARLDG